MLKQQVLRTISKNSLIHKGDGIVVGISGGYDSVCLLHILHAISAELKLKLFPVHVNHMLRGKEALRDEDFVKEFCASLGLEALVKRIDITAKAREEKISLEEAGRNARYDTFHNIAAYFGAEKIAVAHSRNDQVETVLMRIFRGTGLDGLKGMEYKRDKIIRPLLDADRSQIEQYVRECGLVAVTDSSNLHTEYFRNRVRLNVIPEINAAIGADITENILRLSKLVVTDEEFLRYNSELYYEKVVIDKKEVYTELNSEELLKLHPAMQSRVLRKALNDTCGTLEGISFIHVDKLIDLVQNGRTGALIHLPHDLQAQKSYHSLILKRQGNQTVKSYEHKIFVPCEIYIQEINAELSVEIFEIDTSDKQEYIKEHENVYTKFINFDKLGINKDKEIILRNRRNGDVFKPLKGNGTKKLKEYFIDRKIPREQRDLYPLIAVGSEVIWLIGDRISDNYKVTDDTKSILKISFSYKNQNVNG